ncbi:MAG TPA: glucose 1-dehydrogenase [Oceanobacillus sp.]|nr:glucose 1-dehydrogenase [Oceanobacillus sp.]
MSARMENKVALVTGASSGIGRATSIAFAREGAKVVLASRNEESSLETLRMVEAAGGEGIFVRTDVSIARDVENLVQKTLETYGRLDCAFNNAGIAGGAVGAQGKHTADWPEQAFDRMIEINLKSVWLCMREEINAMLADGKGGAIVSTASIAGLVGLETSSAYVAAKHGVIGLTKTAALEYAKKGIRVNAVCPGYIVTEMTREPMERKGDQIMARIPFGRLGTPEDIAEMVVWLCSDRASYVSGAAFNVDGCYAAA